MTPTLTQCLSLTLSQHLAQQYPTLTGSEQKTLEIITYLYRIFYYFLNDNTIVCGSKEPLDIRHSGLYRSE